VLNRQADQLGRAKVGENSQKLAEQLADGGEGLNREFIQLVANLRGVSISQVVTELKKNIEAAQRAAKTEEASRKGRQVQEQDLNAFGRFVSAIEAAADSLENLRTRASLLNDVFDGAINASRVNLGGNRLDQLGRPDRGALEPLALLANVGGQAGQRALATGRSAEDIARVLPGILTDVLRNPAAEGQDQSVQIGEGIARALGHQPGKVPEDLQRAITVVQGEAAKLAGEKGPEGLLERARTDVTKLVEHLNAGNTDPVKDNKKAVELIQAQAQELLDGLAAVVQKMQRVGELEDQLADIRQGNFRTDLQFAAVAAGRPGQAFDNVPVAQLEQNLTDKQRRLAPGVANPFDPDALVRELDGVRTRLRDAEGRVQTEGKKDPNSVAFKGAADEAVRLKAESANLVQALKNLGNVTERTAVLQEKLNRFQQERDSRIGLSERYATADLAQRAQLNYGLLLANRANNLGQANGGDFKGVLDKFGVEEVRAIIDFLRGAGGTTFKGFQGGPRADDLLRKLLEGFGGIGGLDAQQAAEEAAHRNEIQKRQADADKAQKAYIDAQTKLPSELKNTLANLQASFFARLEGLLAQTQLADVQNKQARTGIDLGAAETRKSQAGDLTNLGFASGAQVKENFGAVNKYLDQTAIILAGKKAAAGAGERVDKAFAQSDFAGGQIADFSQGKAGPAYLPEQARFERDQRLKQYVGATFPELDEDAQNRVVGGFRSEFAGRQKLTPENINLARDNPAEYARQAAEALKRALATEFAGGGDNTPYRKAVDRQTEAFHALSGIKGLDFNKLNEAADDPKKLEALKKALEAFREGQSFEDATKKVKELGDELKRLETAAAGLRKSVETGERVQSRDVGLEVQRQALAPFGFAAGGNVFRPKGTDTVPAMLTPGEYVVNAASSQANLSLLERINRARGPVYRDAGGPVDNLPVITPFGVPVPQDKDAKERLKKWLEDQKAVQEKGPMPREVQYRAGGGPIEIPEAYKDQIDDNVRLARALARGRGQEFTAADEERITRETISRQQEKALRADRIEDLSGGNPQAGADAIRFARAKANAEGRPLARDEEDDIARGVAERAGERAAQATSEKNAGVFAQQAKDALQFAKAKANAAGAPLGFDEGQKVFGGAVQKAMQRQIDNAAFNSEFGVVSSDVEQALRFSRALAKAQGRELTKEDEDDIAQRAQGPALRRKNRASEAAIARAAKQQVQAGKFGPASVLGGALGTVGLSLPLVNGEQGRAVPAGQKKAADAKQLRALQEAQYRAAVRDFNRRSGFSNGTARPGAEGQRNIGVSDAERRLKDQEEAFRQAIQLYKRLNGYAAGGYVDGSGPSGVDSVPALLAPGEFVLNAQATSRFGAGRLQRFNQGGQVGGTAEASQDYSALTNALAQFGQSSQLLAQSLTSFSGSANSLAEAMNNMPKSLSGQFTHTVVVNINGAEALAKLQPEIERMVTEQTKEVLGRTFKEQMPDAGVSLN
jgi:hypothetical protein